MNVNKRDPIKQAVEAHAKRVQAQDAMPYNVNKHINALKAAQKTPDKSDDNISAFDHNGRAIEIGPSVIEDDGSISAVDLRTYYSEDKKEYTYRTYVDSDGDGYFESARHVVFSVPALDSDAVPQKEQDIGINGYKDTDKDGVFETRYLKNGSHFMDKVSEKYNPKTGKYEANLWNKFKAWWYGDSDK